MKSKGIIVATAVAAALAMSGCSQKPPQPGSAHMKPYAKKSMNKCKSNKCKSNKCKANQCKANKGVSKS